MKKKLISTQAEALAQLKEESTYIVIDSEIELSAGTLVVGKGNIIDFQGGSFKGTTGSKINLNGCQVIAAPTPIFKNMEVTGFANDKVYAEWFQDSDSTPAHEYINKAIASAKGCPVILSKKSYTLTGSIVISTASTLVGDCDFTIKYDNASDNDEWNTNPIAFDIQSNNVNINVNRIIFPGRIITIKDKNGNDKKKTIPDIGTGIRISGNRYHISVNVNFINLPEKGIELLPGRVSSYGFIQYLNVQFQYIHAVYGIYMNTSAIGDYKQNRITLCSFNGGRLLGDYGVYMEELPDNSKSTYITAINFNNIGFEDLKKIPIYLRNASRLKFGNLRMAENLSKVEEQIPWIDLNCVSYTEINIHGDLDAEQIVANESCSRIIIHGSFLRAREWDPSPFDTMIIDSVWTNNPSTNYKLPVKALTSSISPYQMNQTITANGDLQTIQPTILPAVAGKYAGLKVLPRVLQFKIDTPMTIDLKGLKDYAPCIFYFKVEDAGILTLLSNCPISSLSPLDNDFKDAKTSMQISKNGSYQLVWTTKDGNVMLQVISQT